MFQTDYTLNLADESATMMLGSSFAKVLKAPMVIDLQGDLGAGKTTFTRGFLRGLGYTGNVKSPTYTLVESYYFSELQVHHFDLYRFQSPDEWLDSGLSELFTENSICLIEWAQQGADVLPDMDLSLKLVVQNQGRTCTISPHSMHAKEFFAIWLNSPAVNF